MNNCKGVNVFIRIDFHYNGIIVKRGDIFMNIIDTHCDALLKLQGDARNTHGYFQQERQLNYLNSDALDMNMERRIKGNVKVQFYAIFISPGMAARLRTGRCILRRSSDDGKHGSYYKSVGY